MGKKDSRSFENQLVQIDKFDKKNPGKISLKQELIPNHLKSLNHWCCWKWIWKGNRWTKPPCDIHGNVGNHNKINHSFKEVVIANKDNPDIAGIGFSIREDDSFCGVDIDDCISVEGKIDRTAKKIIKKCGSYTEISPSGKGIRIFGIGKPETFGASKGKNIEVYSKGRYLTVTGNVYGELRSLNKIEKSINKIIKRIKGKKPKKKTDKKLLSGIDNFRTRIIISKLAYIAPDIHRDQWVQIAMAIHDVYRGTEEGFILFDRWSKGEFWHSGKSSKYDEKSVHPTKAYFVS